MRRAKIVATLGPATSSPEQILVLDEKHKRCQLGKASQHDCLLPFDDDGNWCSHEDGGEYGAWSDTTAVKYAKEVRFLMDVMMAKSDESVSSPAPLTVACHRVRCYAYVWDRS